MPRVALLTMVTRAEACIADIVNFTIRDTGAMCKHAKTFYPNRAKHALGQRRTLTINDSTTSASLGRSHRMQNHTKFHW